MSSKCSGGKNGVAGVLKSENCFPCKEVFEEEMTLAGVTPAALFCAGLSTLRAMRFVLGRWGSEDRQF
jgi:hypothetical protein